MKIQFCKELFAIARQKSAFRPEEYHPFEFDIDDYLKKETDPVLYKCIQGKLNFIIKSTRYSYFSQCTNDIGITFRHDKPEELKALKYIKQLLRSASVYQYTRGENTETHLSPGTEITTLRFNRFNEALDKSMQFLRLNNPEKFDKLYEDMQFYRINKETQS